MVTNFGGNIVFSPAVVEKPGTEQEVLDLLRRHRSRQIRAIGRLHSWSPVAATDDVLVDMKLLNSVHVIEVNGQHFADVGAGCQIKRLLHELDRQGDWTLPTVGLIAEQSIAGAAATGTHGSGRYSLSHYLQRIEVACCDPVSGEPVIRVIDCGDELRAARCALGCLGLITKVRIPIRKQYLVEEHFRRYSRLADVLKAEQAYPLQQFFFVPWRWDYFAQHRREVSGQRSWLAPLYRLYWCLTMDVGLHLMVLLLIRLPHLFTLLFVRWVMPLTVIRRCRINDVSWRHLTMNHHLFRHVEIEIFVKASRLEATLQFVRQLLKHLSGEQVTFSVADKATLQREGLWDRLQQARGTYTHQYPICIRKVLPDDTLMSMSSDSEEAYYAISFITYAPVNRLSAFHRFARLLISCTLPFFGSRSHWGKHCPLSPGQVRELYPNLDRFRAVVESIDPEGHFRNPWISRLLGWQPDVRSVQQAQLDQGPCPPRHDVSNA